MNIFLKLLENNTDNLIEGVININNEDHTLGNIISRGMQQHENISLKKQYIIDELIQILKECSFDCVLNAPDIKGSYNCFSFGKDAKGFSYYPDISKDIIQSHFTENKKTIKRQFTKAIYYDKKVYLIDPKKKQPFYLYTNKNKTPVILSNNKGKPKPIYVDTKTDEVFQVKSVNNGSPKLLGYISSKGTIVSKK
jgi:hypothetical protein